MNNIKEQISQLKKSIDDTENKISELANDSYRLGDERQKLIGEFILDNKLLAGTEWKFKVYGDIPYFSYTGAMSGNDSIKTIVDINGSDIYSNIIFPDGIVLKLDEKKASITFSSIKDIFPFAEKFELKVSAGDIFAELQKYIKKVKSLEMICHQFNIKPND